MKVVRVEDVEKLFEKTGNIMTAYEFSQIEPIELTTNEYEVELTYKVTISAFSEDDAVQAVEELIRLKEIPYDYSCTCKLD
jgi:hypothetical protein